LAKGKIKKPRFADGVKNSIKKRSVKMVCREKRIPHANDVFVMIRRDYAQLFGDADASAVMCLFEFWGQNVINNNPKRFAEADTVPIGTKTTRDLEEAMLGILTRMPIMRRVEYLAAIALIKIDKNPNNKREAAHYSVNFTNAIAALDGSISILTFREWEDSPSGSLAKNLAKNLARDGECPGKEFSQGLAKNLARNGNLSIYKKEIHTEGRVLDSGLTQDSSKNQNSGLTQDLSFASSQSLDSENLNSPRACGRDHYIAKKNLDTELESPAINAQNNGFDYPVRPIDRTDGENAKEAAKSWASDTVHSATPDPFFGTHKKSPLEVQKERAIKAAVCKPQSEFTSVEEQADYIKWAIAKIRRECNGKYSESQMTAIAVASANRIRAGREVMRGEDLLYLEDFRKPQTSTEDEAIQMLNAFRAEL
jgi:hypothetical protein